MWGSWEEKVWLWVRRFPASEAIKLCITESVLLMDCCHRVISQFQKDSFDVTIRADFR